MKEGTAMAKDLSVVKELIKEAIDPVALLEYYHVDIPDRDFSFNRIRCACPIHGGDNPSAFSLDLDTKMFTCFTHHCGEHADHWFAIPKQGESARDIFMLIKLLEERKAYEDGAKNYRCSFPRALQIASNLSGVPIDEDSCGYDKETMDRLDNQRWMRQMSRINQEIEMFELDEGEIELFKAQLPLCEYIESRGYESHVLDFFEIGFSPDGIDEDWAANRKDFPGRVVFPVRDTKGSLVGWSGRLAMDDEQLKKKFGKWRHKLDFDKGFTLYNYHNALPFIKEAKEIILVEGTWDVARLWSYGIYNVVAVMGSSLTPEQLSLAISHTIKIKVFLDADGAGKDGARRICEQLKRYVDVYVCSSADKKDPDEMTFDEAWACLENAEKYT